MTDVNKLRIACRTRRCALDSGQQRRHSIAFARQVRRQGLLLRASHVAAYLAADGELDPASLFPALQAGRRRLYLPVLRAHPELKLWFLHHPPGGSLIPNRFGIPEPPLHHRHIRLPWALDLILLPLVAFDRECNRLGMGGGFYDRTLAYLRHCRHWRKPRLVGVAHECQRVESLPTRPWDVGLDMVITERRAYVNPRTWSA
jgi:5-formyltetrahydrofolate cyclo-ligase